MDETEDLTAYQFPLPDDLVVKILAVTPVVDILTCRLTCRTWNSVILKLEILDIKSCFVFDGRKDDLLGDKKCSDYMEESETKNYLWSHLKLRRVVARHCDWLFHQIENDATFTSTIKTLELLNSTLNWTLILQLLLELDNLVNFYDKQDTYCWDYGTFNQGIEEEEMVVDTIGFQHLRSKDKLDALERLRVVIIHRSQLIECTTYLKILQLKCNSLVELEINTDQNFAPQRGNLFYAHLGALLLKTGPTLRSLSFPYKLVCPSYDFRSTDEHRLFREFLNYISDNRWAQTLTLTELETLSIQYGVVPIEGQDIAQKLVPFLQSLPALRTFYCGCVHLEEGMDRHLLDLVNVVPPEARVEFGIFVMDTFGLPRIDEIQNMIRSLAVQTLRDVAREVFDMLPSVGGGQKLLQLKELQYFSRSHGFKSFNLERLICSFPNLTQLNLVDHNSRIDTRHSCEALATIEDDQMQLLIQKLVCLQTLQLIGNMIFLTDFGLTGVKGDIGARMLLTGDYTIQEDESGTVGHPLSNLQSLQALVLRGLGIKVTDVSAKLAFKNIKSLHKLHLFGSHQISSEGRVYLSNTYNITKGCDLQL